MEDGGGDNTKIDAAEKSLGYACELLGVDAKQLAQWLSHRRIQEQIYISKFYRAFVQAFKNIYLYYKFEHLDKKRFFHSLKLILNLENL